MFEEVEESFGRLDVDSINRMVRKEKKGGTRMTDEEMVEEYLEKHNYTSNCIGYFASAYCKQAFLAGLKTERPQWHDLRENPEDLPPVYGMSDCTIDVLTDREDIAYFDYNENCWCDKEACVIDPPKAWCEIPKFKEE